MPGPNDQSTSLGLAGSGEANDAHLVQFYESDSFLVDAVSRFVGAALGTGGTGIIIATPAHQDRLAEQLRAGGLDLTAIGEQGRYVQLDAAETLSRFMVDGWPSEARFNDVVGGAIAAATAMTPDHVRAFGEMVSLLWADGHRDAAIRVEQLWNTLASRLSFTLLCSYSLTQFRGEADGASFLKICGEHSHVIPTESYSALETVDQRLRTVTELQQKAAMLEEQIAERREVERVLDLQRGRTEHLQAWLAAIVESSNDAVIGKTLDGTVISWNTAAENLFGYTAAEMIGQPLSRLVPADRQDDLPTILAAVRAGKRVDHFDTERVRKDGRRIHVSLTVSPIKDTDGTIIGASKIARDVTEQKRADTAKDELLAMLGHELRNPLAAVQSAITAARVDPACGERALLIANRQAGQLRRLVDDLLDVARVARGTIVLRKQRVSLANIVERAVESAGTQLDERGHTLTVSVPADVQLDADPGRLEQVLANLLTNAAKYTSPGGRIEIVAERTREEEIELHVRDNGIGISAEMLPHVFDPFSQSTRGLDRRDGGLGLGLVLVQKLIALHGGRVTAHSAGNGQGADFTIYLSAVLDPDTTPLAEAGGADQRAARSVRVLVVEDNVDAADALSMLLEVLGHQVDVAHDGLAALEAMERARPDLMLVDIGLPGIDGFEVARRARALPAGASTMLVALTGYGRDEDKQRTRAAGFDDHLTKPIEIDRLTKLVGDLAASDA